MTLKLPRRLLAGYPVQRDITTRVGDLDTYGHLNSVRIGQYYEDARAAFYQVAFKDLALGRMLVAQVNTSYIAEAFWPAPIQVGSGISKIGIASCQMTQGLFQEGRCVGLCVTVMVNTDGAASAPISGAVREALDRMLILPENA